MFVGLEERPVLAWSAILRRPVIFLPALGALTGHDQGTQPGLVVENVQVVQVVQARPVFQGIPPAGGVIGEGLSAPGTAPEQPGRAPQERAQQA